MICHHCGSETPALAGSCVVCDTPIDAHGSAPSKALTPLHLPGRVDSVDDESHADQLAAPPASGHRRSETLTLGPPAGRVDLTEAYLDGAPPVSGKRKSTSAPTSMLLD